MARYLIRYPEGTNPEQLDKILEDNQVYHSSAYLHNAGLRTIGINIFSGVNNLRHIKRLEGYIVMPDPIRKSSQNCRKVSLPRLLVPNI